MGVVMKNGSGVEADRIGQPEPGQFRGQDRIVGRGAGAKAGLQGADRDAVRVLRVQPPERAGGETVQRAHAGTGISGTPSLSNGASRTLSTRSTGKAS